MATGYTELALSELLLAKLMGTSPTETWFLPVSDKIHVNKILVFQCRNKETFLVIKIFCYNETGLLVEQLMIMGHIKKLITSNQYKRVFASDFNNDSAE